MSNGYGIDLGTCNLKIYSKAAQAVTNVKNTIALYDKDKIYAYGDDAYSMYEKAPENIGVSFPISNGVISDFNNMQGLLIHVLENEVKAHLKGSDIVLAVPTDITEVEKKAFNDMFARNKSKIKVKSVSLCEKPLADALGMGIDITEPTGVMVVDLGADTTEISVISLGGLVLSNLLTFGGNRLDDDIVTHLKRKYNLLIGRKTAKELKEKIGSTSEGRGESMEVVGRDVVAGLPVSMTIDSDMVYEAIKEDLNSICNSIKTILEKVPPEIAKDIVYSGIYLTGGSSSIHGISDLFNELTNIKMNVAEDGENTVALGLGRILTDNKFRQYGYTMRSRIYS
ncbi:MAG: rod shape-determining protein [Lachnospiraceae bacterium]|jgi:rod shape-determining protein MreB|nr:rod shape-determining protein [Lachnospiraceae bacterium]